MKSKIVAKRYAKFYIIIILTVLLVLLGVLYILNAYLMDRGSNTNEKMTNKSYVNDKEPKPIKENPKNKESSISQATQGATNEPKEFKVYYNNKDVNIDGICIFFTSSNNEIMISGFERFV